MRISDWSSDVCSSDLLGTEKGTVENDLCNRPPPIRRNVLGGCHEAAGGVVDQNRNRTERRLDFVERASHLFGIPDVERSEERRVGKECVSTCRARWSPYH